MPFAFAERRLTREECEHALATSLRDDILPRVARALRETERAYEAGRYSYLELRSAQDEAGCITGV